MASPQHECLAPDAPAGRCRTQPKSLPWLAALTVGALGAAGWLARGPEASVGRLSAVAAVPPQLEGPWTVPVEAREALDPVSPALAEEIRRSFYQYASPAINARWFHPRLDDMFEWREAAPGLEGLERDVLWAQYELDGARVSVFARFPSVALAVATPAIPEALRGPAGGLRTIGPAAPDPWPDAPASVADALWDLWGQFVIAPTEAEPSPCRYGGLPALTARLPDVAGETWWADCLLVCDGKEVGILLTKPPGVWRMSTAPHIAQPIPQEAEAAPLNPKSIVLQQTGLYRDALGRFVDKPEVAARGLIRVLSLGSDLLSAGATRLYGVPVDGRGWPDSVWRAVEFHALASAAVDGARSALGFCAHGESADVAREPSRSAYLAEWADRLPRQAEAWRTVVVPAEREADRDTVTAAQAATQQAVRAVLDEAPDAAERVREASRLVTLASDSLDDLLRQLSATCSQYEQDLYSAW